VGAGHRHQDPPDGRRVLLPGRACGDCGTVTCAEAPPGFHPGSVSYRPALNGAAVLLSCSGNVPAGRPARLIGMLTGQDVSSGWVDKAVASHHPPPRWTPRRLARSRGTRPQSREATFHSVIARLSMSFFRYEYTNALKSSRPAGKAK
jgi:hypothetical protein